MSSKLQRVWLILTKVRVVGENPIGLTLGSKPLVQCFVPETAIEVALSQIEKLLQAEGMRRVDVLTCSSFEGDESEDEAADFLKRDIHQARSSGKAMTGTFFTSPDTATFEGEETNDA